MDFEDKRCSSVDCLWIQREKLNCLKVPLLNYKIFLAEGIFIPASASVRVCLATTEEARIQTVVSALEQNETNPEWVIEDSISRFLRYAVLLDKGAAFDPWTYDGWRQDEVTLLLEQKYQEKFGVAPKVWNSFGFIKPSIRERVERLPIPGSNPDVWKLNVVGVVEEAAKNDNESISNDKVLEMLVHAAGCYGRRHRLPINPVKFLMEYTALNEVTTHVFVLGIPFSNARWIAASELKGIENIAWKLLKRYIMDETPATLENLNSDTLSINGVCPLVLSAVYVGAKFLARLPRGKNPLDFDPSAFILPNPQEREILEIFLTKKIKSLTQNMEELGDVNEKFRNFYIRVPPTMTLETKNHEKQKFGNTLRVCKMETSNEKMLARNTSRNCVLSASIE